MLGFFKGLVISHLSSHFILPFLAMCIYFSQSSSAEEVCFLFLPLIFLLSVDEYSHLTLHPLLVFFWGFPTILLVSCVRNLGVMTDSFLFLILLYPVLYPISLNVYSVFPSSGRFSMVTILI